MLNKYGGLLHFDVSFTAPVWGTFSNDIIVVCGKHFSAVINSVVEGIFAM